MNIKDWLDRATEKIGFDPDRAVVRRELEDHLQDRQERYAAKGLSPEEAETAAVADMGDPAEIAEELGKLHRPFWGYLWTFSKLALGLAFILAFIGVFGGRGNNWFAFDPPPLAATDPERALATVENGVAAWDFSGTVRVGAYRVSATAFLTQRFEDYYSLAVYLRFVPLIPWEPSKQARYFIVVTDDSDGVEQHTSDGVDSFPWQYWSCGPVVWYEERLALEEPRVPDWMDVELGTTGNYTVRLNFREEVLEG